VIRGEHIGGGVNAGLTGAGAEEFRVFMGGRWPAMVRLAYGLTGDLGRAQDVAQAAFARAYASWGRATRDGDPEAFLWRLIVSENSRRFRRRRVTQNPPVARPEQEVAESPAVPGQHAALLAALGRLSPRQRAVIVLRFWLDLSEAETARVMRCTVGTVHALASRALAIARPGSAVTDTRFTGDGFTDEDVIEGGL
jgi:RNA polymerase sigma-70 factor (sigma-E family)